MESQEKLEYGLKVYGKIMGEDKAEVMRAQAESKGFASRLTGMALNYAFADVWGDGGLELKQRSLVTIAILIATRQTLELKNHIRIGVRNGLTVRELEQVLYQCVPYLGFPAAATATTVMIEVLRELGLDLESKTAEERGLL